MATLTRRARRALTSLPVDGVLHAVDPTGRTVCGIRIAGRTSGPLPTATACVACFR